MDAIGRMVNVTIFQPVLSTLKLSCPEIDVSYQDNSSRWQEVVSYNFPKHLVFLFNTFQNKIQLYYFEIL